MPALSDRHQDQLRHRAGALTLPLLLWLSVPFAALALAAARVPLWAAFPQAGERFALQYVTAAQFAVAALCFPTLVASFRNVFPVLASGWPIALIAGALAAVPISRACAAELLVSAFLIVLSLWRQILRSTLWQNLAAGIASTWAIGGAMLFYWRTELQIMQARDGVAVSPNLNEALSGPIVAADRIAMDPAFIPHTLWALLASLGAAAVIAMVLRKRWGPSRYSESRQSMPKVPPLSPTA